MMSHSDSPPISFIQAGSQVLITGGSFVQNNDATKALNPLYEKVAPNAILNAGGRADAVRCHPGTREEVIGKIEKWISANHFDGHPIFWLSGPAGAGKSAIVQTIAEKCIEYEVPMVNFFFFRGDGTRNHSEPVVATLLFQLLELFPAMKAHIVDIVANNPVILRQSMQTQFSSLIENPLRAIRKISGQGPPVVLIDGLDECCSRHGQTEQTSLLRILHNVAAKVDPTFVVLVASRTEAHLTMTFNDIGTSPNSIYLDESYRPVDDIRLFLSEEFSRIRRTHSLRGTLDQSWPLPADFDSILNKSSGQFIFASTVTRFISNSAASPKRSLEIVLGLRPVTKTSPFSTLDSLYTYIMSQTEDWESVQDILAAQRFLTTSTLRYPGLTFILSPLGYTRDDILSNLSDLTAILQLKPDDDHLTIFHASLDDFLYDKSRAGRFYIDINVFKRKLVPPHFRQAATFGSLYYCFQILSLVTEPDEILNTFLESYLPYPEIFVGSGSSLADGVFDGWMDSLAKLYQWRDPQLYQYVTNRWQEWFANGMDTQDARRGSRTIEKLTAKQATLHDSSRSPIPQSLSNLFLES